MNNNQNKLDLAELIQEQIEHVLNVLDCDLICLANIEDRLNLRDKNGSQIIAICNVT